MNENGTNNIESFTSSVIGVLQKFGFTHEELDVQKEGDCKRRGLAVDLIGEHVSKDLLEQVVASIRETLSSENKKTYHNFSVGIEPNDQKSCKTMLITLYA